MKITFTGIDAKTDLSELPYGPEYGVLYSCSPEGRGRYPSRREIWQILRRLTDRGDEIALHVCGSAARQQLIAYHLSDLTHYVQRIQVNGSIFPEDLKVICERYSDHTIITQHSIQNGELTQLALPNHAILVDGSGGRGVSPKEWRRPTTEKAVGFAGGLGPENVESEIVRIQAVANGDFWVDMEGKVRTENDWLDVRRVQRVFESLDAILA
jgi:phosphoribosylanthranilate isomerase